MGNKAIGVSANDAGAWRHALDTLTFATKKLNECRIVFSPIVLLYDSGGISRARHALREWKAKLRGIRRRFRRFIVNPAFNNELTLAEAARDDAQRALDSLRCCAAVPVLVRLQILRFSTPMQLFVTGLDGYTSTVCCLPSDTFGFLLRRLEVGLSSSSWLTMTVLADERLPTVSVAALWPGNWRFPLIHDIALLRIPRRPILHYGGARVRWYGSTSDFCLVKLDGRRPAGSGA